MNGLLQVAFLKALGWSLVHSLWQMGVLSLLYIIITNKGRSWNSKLRHNIALLLSASGGILFLATLLWEYNSSNSTFLSTVFPFTDSETYLSPYSSLLQLMASAYLLAVFFLFARFFRQFQVTRQLRNSPVLKAPLELRLFLKETANHLGLKRTIKIGFSAIISTPLTIGFWKPVILLPVALLNHLSIQQAEAILLHELNHIKRNDYLINIFIATLDILLFFNPFARFFTTTLLRERENHCDDMVLQFQFKAGEYAKALLILEQQRLQPLPVFALPATGNKNKMLLQRIQRILYGSSMPHSFSPRLFGLFFLALIIGAFSLSNQRQQKMLSSVPAKPVISSASENTPFILSSFPTSVSKNDKPAEKNSLVQNGFETVKYPLIDLQQLATELKAMAVQKKIDAINASNEYIEVPGFAANESDRDYSLSETNQSTPEPIASIATPTPAPYIPENSFNYQVIEDTVVPRKVLRTQAEEQATEDLAKALKAIETINWLQLEKNIQSGKSKIDIIKLQEELKKALTSIDWKKIQSETLASLKTAEQDALIASSYKNQIEKFKKEKLLQQAYENKIREQILNERLNQNNLQFYGESPKKASGNSTKKQQKIVVI